MKFDCGPPKCVSQYAKKRKMENWHDHFAWWPIRLGQNDCRWLETVQRKYNHWYTYNNYGIYPDYREKNEN